MKQSRLKEFTLDWDKIYVNHPRKKVFIFKTKERKEIIKEMNLEDFKKLLKKVPNINFLITMFL